MNRLKHIYFWALPIGASFWHKDGWYIKTNEEEAYSILDNKRWRFEGHYGAVIHNDLFKKLGLEKEAERDGDIPQSAFYYHKLFGIPLEAS